MDVAPRSCQTWTGGAGRRRDALRLAVMIEDVECRIEGRAACCRSDDKGNRRPFLVRTPAGAFRSPRLLFGRKGPAGLSDR